jgi:dihydrofolate reductase
VVTHRLEDQPEPASGFEFANGIEAALDQDREIAGDRQVGIGGGASIAQQALQAELVDELQLERTRVLDSPFATHIKLRV